MKSTIKIALGQNNEPVIKMMAVSTDDLRDQLCKQWYQKLGGESYLARVMFTDNQSVNHPDYKGDPYNELIITPLSPEEFHQLFADNNTEDVIIDQAWLDTITEVMESRGYIHGKTFGYVLGQDARVSAITSHTGNSLMWYYTKGPTKRIELSTLDISSIPDYAE